MNDVLLVIDMQNDFIDGALGTPEAVGIVDAVKEKIENFDGRVFFTRDTHHSGYLQTQEGKKLPVEHCIEGTHGWEIRAELDALRKTEALDKSSFGSVELGEMVMIMNEMDPLDSVTLVGLCTDICVISCALMIKAFVPEVPVRVDAKCCAGVTRESHENALRAMESCQVEILNWH